MRGGAEGRRRITGRGEKAGGSSNSLLQPRGKRREFASDQKNVTCVRQSQAKSDAALRSSGNSKEIYVPCRREFSPLGDTTEKGQAGDTRSVRLREVFDLQLDELVKERSNTFNI